MTFNVIMRGYPERKIVVLGSGETPEAAQDDACDKYNVFICDITGTQVWNGVGDIPDWAILTDAQLASISTTSTTT